MHVWIKVVIISIIIISGSLTAIVLSWPAALKKIRNTIWLLGEPEIENKNFLSVEYVTGLNLPTKMAFINNDILVLEKNTGFVRHITSDGTLLDKPVLALEVASLAESGLLGILSKNDFVYLYYTTAEKDGKLPDGNKVVRYNWTGNNLINPVLIKELPANPKTGYHNGGAMTLANDGTVYAVIGDFNNTGRSGVLQNFPDGTPDDRGVILPVDPDGPYFAMGVRNSYGLTIDPLTGNMWDTENGASTFDEINLVFPKFNSGWKKIMGPSKFTHLSDLPEFDVANLPKFEDFEYSDPEFSWVKTIAPTALVFPTSDIFNKYHDSLLVGDCNNGNIYQFKLNSDRNGFVFRDSSLKDLVFNQGDNDTEIIIGKKYGCITDLQFGPDGYLYVVSLTRGSIFKLSPQD